MDKNVIKEYLDSGAIENYTINDDGTVDVEGNVDISFSGSLGYIPVKFGRVNGFFACNNTELTTLKNSPDTVTGGFNCSANDITSLEYLPKELGDWVDISENNLKSLEGCPSEVMGDFHCGYNRLTTLKYSPKRTGGDFFCEHNELTNLEHCPEYVGDRFYCTDNKLTTLEYCPIEVGGVMDLGENKISDFKGFVTKFTNIEHKRPITITNNPITKLMEKSRFTDDIIITPTLVEWFNTFKVINGKEVNLKRLKYVCQEFDMSIDLEKIKKYYTIK